MPDLVFRIEEASALRFAAVPTVAARMHIINAIEDQLIHSISLQCQVQLQPLGRTYNAAEEAKLLDLFGERVRWGTTMKPLLWTNVALKVPPFTGDTSIDLLLPCSMDFDVAANKYFYGLKQGNISVVVMFSGTVFYAGEHGPMQIAQIPWDREARFQLSVSTWRAAIDLHYADSAWLRLPRDTFDRLYQYKVDHGVPRLADVLNRLLDESGRFEEQCEIAPGGRV